MTFDLGNFFLSDLTVLVSLVIDLVVSLVTDTESLVTDLTSESTSRHGKKNTGYKSVFIFFKLLGHVIGSMYLYALFFGV